MSTAIENARQRALRQFLVEVFVDIAHPLFIGARKDCQATRSKHRLNEHGEDRIENASLLQSVRIVTGTGCLFQLR